MPWISKSVRHKELQTCFKGAVSGPARPRSSRADLRSARTTTNGLRGLIGPGPPSCGTRPVPPARIGSGPPGGAVLRLGGDGPGRAYPFFPKLFR